MVPTSTYRIQFNKDFTLKHLDSIIDYLHQLGISTIYASPIFKATPGSMHGYDVTDPHEINPEIGTLEELRTISSRLKKLGMSWLQDIVPNHMAYNRHNWRLMDVLERGEHSSFAVFFDINWNHYDEAYRGKIMVPFLGASLETLLEEGNIKVLFGGGELKLSYYENEYPLNASAWRYILHHIPDNGTEIETAVQLLWVNNAPYEVYSKHKRDIYTQLEQTQNNVIQQALDQINSSPDAVFEIVREQHYVLVPHYETNRVINYRRFFTVNDLICLKMEDEQVFDQYHSFIHQLYREKIFDGLRIDHIDGLHNPEEYIERLRKLFGEECYIIAEKILEFKEYIPKRWKLHGTSGYEFLSYTNQVLTNIAGAEQIWQYYNRLQTSYNNYDETVLNNKHKFLEQFMNGELVYVSKLLKQLKLVDEHDEDTVKQSLAAFMVALPVYRIYPATLPISEVELATIEEAYEKAYERNPHLKKGLDEIVNLFREQQPKNEHHVYFLNRLMQYTGPLAAKGVEDTTFYNYNALIAHNEVGDAPCRLGISIEEFHEKMQLRQQQNRYSLNTTSTHDTKRGEDGRMRINLLAEQPTEFIDKIQEWRNINSQAVQTISGEPAPSVNDEYFIYQSLINGLNEDGTLTGECVNRLKDYLRKALREGKDKTSWHEPNEAYENACMNFIDAITAADSEFMQSFKVFHDELRAHAWKYYLLQAAIKYTAPGIPDTYQGCEMLDLSYVDPDNRRPVNYDKRRQALEFVTRSSDKSGYGDGASAEEKKFEMVYRLLQLRKQYSKVFDEGEYTPIATGREHLLAYSRSLGNEEIIVVLNLRAIGENKEVLILPVEGSSIQLENVFSGATQVGNEVIFGSMPVMIFHVVRKAKHAPGAVKQV